MFKDSARPRLGGVSAFAPFAPLALGALIALAACGPGSLASKPAPRPAKPPELAPKDQAKCDVAKTAPAEQEGTAAGMVNLPAGRFLMGSNDGPANERPAHQVSVAGFAMDVTEVTTAAYTACVRAGRCTAAGTTSYCNYGHSDKDNHPINCVDWDQATAYCGSVGKRLPTEEEWEYAARGTDGRTYPWGNEEPGTRACWNRWTNRKGTCSVGSYASGVFGLNDMAGNVWEWTSSGYSEDYANNRAGAARVSRGGAWFGVAWFLRSSFRVGGAPSGRSVDLGFRCAR